MNRECLGVLPPVLHTTLSLAWIVWAVGVAVYEQSRAHLPALV